jgi:hypothetical protein
VAVDEGVGFGGVWCVFFSFVDFVCEKTAKFVGKNENAPIWMKMEVI